MSSLATLSRSDELCLLWHLKKLSELAQLR